jgi:transcriptional regulator with XRE-family HTH domain
MSRKKTSVTAATDTSKIISEAARPEAAGNIRELRSALGLSQQKFAEKLGMENGRVTVARWESGEFQPTADKYIQLAKLAKTKAPRIALWFWEKVGIDIATLSGLFPELERLTKEAEKRLEDAVSTKDSISLPILQGIWAGTHQKALNRMRAPLLATRAEVEKWVMVPKEFVPNPTMTCCLRAPDLAMLFTYSSDGIIVVDSSPSATPAIGDYSALSRLNGLVVAAHFVSRDKNNLLRRGLHLRRLYAKNRPSILFEGDMRNSQNWSSRDENDPVIADVIEQGRTRVISDNGEWCILGVATCWFGSSKAGLSFLGAGMAD